MEEKVTAYLEKKRQEKRLEIEGERKDLLLNLGLYDVEYKEGGGTTPEYLLYDSQERKAYRRIYPDLSDEEYAEICSYEKEDEETRGNTIARILTVIAWITYICGFIFGIVLATQEVPGAYSWRTETVFSWSTAISYWALSFISGSMFLGFAEIIKLLHKFSGISSKES